jgi:hypothetical protein
MREITCVIQLLCRHERRGLRNGIRRHIGVRRRRQAEQDSQGKQLSHGAVPCKGLVQQFFRRTDL